MLYSCYNFYSENISNYWSHFPQAKIQFIQGVARFTNDTEPTVEVEGRKYTAPHILIATGGQPLVMSDDDVPGQKPLTLM